MIINGCNVGPSHPVYVVAELSSNHNGSLARAHAILDAAKAAGADACKIQVYDPVKLATARGGCGKVLDAGPWHGRTLLDIYTEGHTPVAWLPEVVTHAAALGLTLFPSVFDVDIIPLLAAFDFPAYKVASFECGHLDLIRALSDEGVPLIISTGMADGRDISAALQAAAGTTQIALLHCVSDYPCPIEKANLGRIEHMRRVYAKPIGWSDHTLGSTAAIAAVAVGACIVEKHLTLRRADGGLDAAFSVEPDEFRAMADACRQTWLAMQEPAEASEPYKHLRSVA